MSRIAVVGGGGAGLLSAWLLQEAHSVVVFEEESFLGGHAHSVPVSTERGVVWVDTGFRYFFPHTYPIFSEILKMLEVRTCVRSAGMSFSDAQGQKTLTLPPTNLRSLLRLISSPRNLLWAASFYWFLRSGLSLVKAQDWQLSLKAYLNSRKIPVRVYEDYLVPALAGFWGAPVSAMFDFPAYDVLRVMQQGKFGNPSFCCVEGGGTAYAEALRQHSPGVRFETGTAVQRVRKTEKGWMIQRSSGEEGPFDQVIVATGAWAVPAILGDHPLARLAAEFGHFETEIVVHRDPRMMPQERFAWTNLNVRFDGNQAWTTEWAGRDLGANVFRTWLPAGHPAPEQLEGRRSFRHLLVDGKSRARQLELARMQGQDGLYLAGMYTCDVDNHESVAMSAVQVARALAPQNPRLARLPVF